MKQIAHFGGTKCSDPMSHRVSELGAESVYAVGDHVKMVREPLPATPITGADESA